MLRRAGYSGRVSGAGNESGCQQEANGGRVIGSLHDEPNGQKSLQELNCHRCKVTRV